jgi:hypothetical protein
MWSPTPPIAGTIRWGFSSGSTPLTLNPYFFDPSVKAEGNLVRSVYDTLYATNPLNSSQVLDWLTYSHQNRTNSQLGYIPPAGTLMTVRNALRNDVYFQDGSQLNASDVAFSYSTLISTPQAKALPPITGIRVLSAKQIDINLGTTTPNIGALGNLTIIPQAIWKNYPGGCVGGCQFGFPADPVVSNIFIGSGPWKCLSASGVLGGGCSSSGNQSPGTGGGFGFARFGKGLKPGTCLERCYFRSSGVLALWIWSGMTGDSAHDNLVLSQVSACYGQAAIALTTSATCARWQQGTGTGGEAITDGRLGCPASTTCGVPVGMVQFDIVQQMWLINWVSPFNWASSPPGPTGIAFGPTPRSFDGILAPVLYEGTAVLSPASIAGCAAYPVGGYDC